MASYLRPDRLGDALAALQSRPRTILAGGTDHFPARASHTPEEDILDITAITGLRAIGRQGADWRIPALATWTDLIEARLPPQFDALIEAAGTVGGVQIQNCGTLVGNICNASPAADGIPPLLALDARVELASDANTRVLDLPDFLLGPRLTARRPEELVTALLVPDRPQARAAFAKLGARRYLVISIVTLAVSLELDEAGCVTAARVAVGACSPVARRLPLLEGALVGSPPSGLAVTAECLAPLVPIDDVRGTAWYRISAAAELLARTIEGKRFFFEKKQQKTFTHLGYGL
jgi:CO/xanthine dehydrogenase FAD-binding subunit